MHNGTNQPKIQAQRVKIAAEFTIPIKHLEIRVTRKPGDGGWIRSLVALAAWYGENCTHPCFCGKARWDYRVVRILLCTNVFSL